MIATVLGAYCPFLIETHLCKMFLHVETAEQCFHNALKLTDALRYIGIEFEINACSRCCTAILVQYNLIHMFYDNCVQ